tara:strand:+ start:198 stop:680 length:483 start_codon:yes stop_codon:yes gene_type:complete
MVMNDKIKAKISNGMKKYHATCIRKTKAQREDEAERKRDKNTPPPGMSQRSWNLARQDIRSNIRGGISDIDPETGGPTKEALAKGREEDTRTLNIRIELYTKFFDIYGGVYSKAEKNNLFVSKANMTEDYSRMRKDDRVPSDLKKKMKLKLDGKYKAPKN